MTRLIIWLTMLVWAGTSQGQNFVQVSKTDPHYFATSDGKTYVPIGLNLCWPRFIDDEAEGLAKMDMYFRRLSENGGNYARIWLSAPFWEIETQQAGQYDEQKLKRFDQLLTLAQHYGIHLKICLENFRKLTGYPAMFPGSVPFDRPIYASANGGPLADMNQYLDSETGRQLFLKRAKKLAERYANHPAIFGWELWNEMNSVSGKNWEEWTKIMLGEVKSLFPNHLVMQSLGSYDKESQRAIYQRITSLPDNDVAQVHRYIDNGASWKICQAPMDTLASQATQDLLNFQTSKPVLAAEVGAVEANHAGPWKLYPNDTSGTLLHDILFAPFFTGAAGPGHCWHWDSYVEKNNLWWHFGRFAEAIKGFDPAQQQAVPFTTSLPNGLRLYGLRGKTQTILWIRDGQSNWQTELAQGKPARIVTNVTLPLRQFPAKRIDSYNPWKNQHVAGKVSGKSIALPDFTRSIIVKLYTD
ncbi:cellulase family glycosylhydrolase [Spirosoma sp. HMF4905]|uniref:mannan endo-1,4-beta-mannosidase n=1 Tax=Spirosoma arboris TaxID=2682092 RepID=A0A7K1SBK5_9BACT|nr:cellulase family glycosylhydrolase [Spirosoma arboris]MVM31204.1 cellulase family glycosylhydrolase [Spirosoma arboris]